MQKETPQSRALPDTRVAKTHKFNIVGYEGYITVGLFEDGTPGELFITMADQGSTIRELLDAIAILTSTGLQYGIPLEVFIKKFERSKFEPYGFTNNPNLRNTTSILDYVFRWLKHEFITGPKNEA